jgi:hypothetical protein
MAKRRERESIPPYKCEMCDELLADKFSKKLIDGWDWFTGFFDRTRHFCPKHSNSIERHRMFAESRVNPVTTIKEKMSEIFPELRAKR